MTEKDFDYFYAVAKYLSFSEAARHLYISQPVLSRQIAKLEAELGFMLFFRSKKEVRLTPGGILFLEKYQELHNMYKLLLRDSKHANSENIGNLGICFQEGQSFDDCVIPLIRKFETKYENIVVDVQYTYFKAMLENIHLGKTDIAISLLYEEDEMAGLRYHKIDAMPSYIVISSEHPLASVKNLDFAMFSEYDLLVADSAIVPNSKDFATAQCRSCGIYPKAVRTATSYSTISLWLSLDMGFVIMTRNMWYSNPKFKFIPLPNDACIERIASWHRSNRNPAIQMFLNCF